jgi:hypothetical protein
MLQRSASNAARSRNIATEMRSGRPRAQAIAIGYSVQREEEKKKKLRGAVRALRGK